MDASPGRGPRLSPRAGALAGIAATWLAWLALVFLGFAGERAACPSPPGALPVALGVLGPLVATAGFGLAVWTYRTTAGAPSSQWLLGAAGLYVSALGWAAAVTGGIALLAIDLCAVF